MKRIILLIALALPLSCMERMNDLVHEEVPAEITAFEIENQKSAVISRNERTVHVEMPADTDLSKLKLVTFEYTEGAKLSREIAAGDILDISAPLEVELFTYDPYVWTITAHSPLSPGAPVTLNGPDPGVELTADGPQVYNMGFDLWSKHPDNEAVDVMYASDATEAEQSVWNNYGLFISAAGGDPVIAPVHEPLAVASSGKAALKLTSGVFSGSLVPGGAYTGGASMWPLIKSMDWGVPFTARPLALEGYVLYQPGTIDNAEDPYLDWNGKQDIAHVFVLLTDGPVTVSPPEKYIDFTQDERVIGYAKMVFNETMTDYQHFRLNIIYRSDDTPSCVTIMASASALGDYLTGAVGSTLYVDELSFLYSKN